MSLYQITTATAEHIEPIVQLWTKLMEIHKEFDLIFFSDIAMFVDEYKTEIENLLNEDDKLLLIATNDNRVIGYVTAQIIRFNNLPYNSYPVCSIGDIMIESNYQHLGIGKAFMEKVKEWSKNLNIYRMESNVFSKNNPALSFFKNQGFTTQFHKLSIEF